MRYTNPIITASLSLLCLLAVSLFQNASAAEVSTAETEKLGVHLLTTGELLAAKQMISTEQTKDQWHYVTIPFTLDDVGKNQEWQDFFDLARENKIIPIVRLTTRFEDEAWQVPNRYEITQLVGALNKLSWPTQDKHIIVFNEVNHRKEWSGRQDPAEYARILRFTASWAHSENNGFVVLPAAMDLAAPNGPETTEAFTYLTMMLKEDPEVFSYIDAWNSHSYPNPGFSSSPLRNGQNSLRGFEHELAFLKRNTDRDLNVFITETGWEDNGATNRWLSSYYEYALEHIWSDEKVVAVTPFVFKGDPGPFSKFSFVSGSDEPTHQYHSLQTALRRVYNNNEYLALKINN